VPEVKAQLRVLNAPMNKEADRTLSHLPL